MVDEKKLKAKGNLPQYIRWPLYLNFIWLVMAALGFTISIKTGVLMTFAAVLYLCISATVYLLFKPNIMRNLVDFGAEYGFQRQCSTHAVFRGFIGYFFF